MHAWLTLIWHINISIWTYKPPLSMHVWLTLLNYVNFSCITRNIYFLWINFTIDLLNLNTINIDICFPTKIWWKKPGQTFQGKHVIRGIRLSLPYLCIFECRWDKIFSIRWTCFKKFPVDETTITVSTTSATN